MKKVKKAANTNSSQITIGPKKLTRFEKARIVGARALQVAMGAPILIDVKNSSMSPIDIALTELDEKILPMSIRRRLPDGTSENLAVNLLLD